MASTRGRQRRCDRAAPDAYSPSTAPPGACGYWQPRLSEDVATVLRTLEELRERVDGLYRYDDD